MTFAEQVEANERAYLWGNISKRAYLQNKDYLLNELRSRAGRGPAKLRYSSPVDSRLDFDVGRGDKLKMRAITYRRTPNHAGAVVLPYACSNCPDDFADTGNVYFDHDDSRPPIAQVMEAKQHGDGVDIVAKWSKSPRARDTRTVFRERARAGKLNYASASFKIPEGGQRIEWLGDRFGYVIDRFALKEVSLVRQPCDEMAFVTAV